MRERARVLLVREVGSAEPGMQLQDGPSGAPIVGVTTYRASTAGLFGSAELSGELTFTVGPAGTPPWPPGTYTLPFPEWRIELRFHDEAQLRAHIEATGIPALLREARAAEEADTDG